MSTPARVVTKKFAPAKIDISSGPAVSAFYPARVKFDERGRRVGATPLIVVPQFGAESEVEKELRRRIVDESGVPYALVVIDAGWRLPWDRHPNPRAAHTIAEAIAAALAAQLRER